MGFFLEKAGGGEKRNCLWLAYRGVCVPIVAIMRERHIAHAEPMVHPEHARAVADLMQTFDANQTGDAAGVEMGHDVGRALNKAKYTGKPLHQGMYEIDLLQRCFDYAGKLPLLLIVGVSPFFVRTLAAAGTIWTMIPISTLIFSLV